MGWQQSWERDPGLRQLPELTDRHRSFLEVSSETPRSPSLCIPGRDVLRHREGDYFGILMEAKVTSFPFSILDNPMYWGSTAVYLGWSLM
ncbi:hypothetical protein QYF61_004725 [Mycteria americana]|uniref:phosphatidyl-N-methylethanolamine N-methyltransferase n=1 Tax=Mycteria americana TaxID=33587 RepID=A0AAN7MNM9_MYCAM|nr:hypothetical protein QYF61_004725 [Mycteria americana]